MRGTDIELKAHRMAEHLRRSMEVPYTDVVALTSESKNMISACIMVFELITRGKADVLRDRFKADRLCVSEEETADACAALQRISDNCDIDADALYKRIRHHDKTPSRKLYISDLHFFHENINSYLDHRGFRNYNEMNEYLISQWNSSVTKKDEVYILGDFSVSKGKATNQILEQLNGKKYLVQGNHDKFLEDKSFDRTLFQWIKPYAEIQDERKKVILSHYPVFCYNGQYRTTQDGEPLSYMMYGHVHNTHDEILVNAFINMTRKTMVTSRYLSEPHPIPCNMINCFCMFSDYVPLTLSEWIRLDAERRSQFRDIET